MNHQTLPTPDDLVFNPVTGVISDKPLPPWTYYPVDGETCAQITLDLDHCRKHYDWKINDSRDFNGLCVAATRLFQERHYDADWDETDWNECVDALVAEVVQAVNKDPSWLNSLWAMSDQSVQVLREHIQATTTPAVEIDTTDPFITALSEALTAHDDNG